MAALASRSGSLSSVVELVVAGLALAPVPAVGSFVEALPGSDFFFLIIVGACLQLDVYTRAMYDQ